MKREPIRRSNDEGTASDARRARRRFVLGSLLALPAAALATSCASEAEAEAAEVDQSLAHSRPDDQGRSCALPAGVMRERLRWRRLLDVHMGSENAHDLPGVMATFSDQGEMIFNRLPFLDAPSIAAGHVLFGMSQGPGALVDTQVIPEREYYTDDSVIVEGRVVAKHVGDVLGFVGTGALVDMPYTAIYRFDRDDKLVSERIVMNWQALAGS
jgi:hypothetical protein